MLMRVYNNELFISYIDFSRNDMNEFKCRVSEKFDSFIFLILSIYLFITDFRAKNIFEKCALNPSVIYVRRHDETLKNVGCSIIPIRASV